MRPPPLRCRFSGCTYLRAPGESFCDEHFALARDPERAERLAYEIGTHPELTAYYWKIAAWGWRLRVGQTSRERAVLRALVLAIAFAYGLTLLGRR